MKMNLTSAFFLLIFFVQLFVLAQWFGYKDFTSPFHFSLFDLQLRIIESVHNDKEIPLSLVRMLHNKAVGSVLDVFTHYLQFWNILFLSRFISLAGVIGLGAGLYYFFAGKKSKRLWLLFVYLLLVPFIEIFLYTKLPYLFRLVVLAVPFVAWSMWGYWYILQEKKISWTWIVLLLLLSIWYQLALV